jgi:tungstate transport system substrate-binding protein
MKNLKSFWPLALVRKALPAIVFVVSGRGVCAVHHHGVHHVHRAVGAVWISAARVQEGQRPGCEGGGLGTGQALDTARRGDADVLFVHDQVAEEKFVADGWGVKRYPVMYNDFILVGPKATPRAPRARTSWKR